MGSPAHARLANQQLAGKEEKRAKIEIGDPQVRAGKFGENKYLVKANTGSLLEILRKKSGKTDRKSLKSLLANLNFTE